MNHGDTIRGQLLKACDPGAEHNPLGLAAARLGASRVLACDINPLTLSLLRDGAAASGVEDGAIVTCECDLEQIATRRRNMPLETQRRGDLYALVDRKPP